MQYQVVILKSAKQDLQGLKAEFDSAPHFPDDVWQASYDKIRESIQRLENSPNAGSIPDEIEKLNLVQYRQVICGMNRILYELRQNAVYVHLIADTRRKATDLLMRRLMRSV